MLELPVPDKNNCWIKFIIEMNPGSVKTFFLKIGVWAYPMKTEHFCSQVVPTNLDMFRS